MEKNVLITIGGFQSAGEDQDRVDLISAGQYYWKNEKHFLIYEEAHSQEGITTTNMIRIGPEEVSVKKKGAANSNMVFLPSQETLTEYETPYGTLTLTIHTNRIRIRETEKKIVVMIDYWLAMDGEKLSDHYIRIEVVPQSEGVSLR